jgi:cytochrome P450
LHIEKRKPWNRAFSSTAIKEYEILVAKRVRQLVSCLEDVIEGSDEKANVAMVDIAQWFDYFR